MSDSQTIASLDIGTYKMQVLVGEIVDNNSLHIIGMGRARSEGVKKGDIIDIRKAALRAQEAIVNAEKSNSASLKSVCLGISGTHVMGFRNLGSANVSGADGLVRKADVERACEDARSKNLPEGRTYICRICCGFYLDGQFTVSPLGKKANRIDAEFWMMHGDSEKIYDAMHLVESFGLEVDHLMFSGICSAKTVTTPVQRDDGVVCIDIGCGTSDYAFYKHGKPIQAGVVPVGGDHLTNDISLGLKLSPKNSESLKIRFGAAAPDESDRNKSVWAVGDKQIGDRKISLYSMRKIMNARLAELFELIRQDLGEYVEDGAIRSLVLTGGTSRIAGICELAQEIFGVPCSNGRFNAAIKEELREPEFATSIGLLEHALSDSLLELRNRRKGIFEETADIFRKIFNR